LGRKCDRTTKNPAKNWSGVNYQGASTYLISGSTLPLSGQFDKISENWAESAIDKKNPAKNWSGVNYQGASTYLISGSRCTCSGQFDKISENWAESTIDQKKPGQKLVGS
jgi:hypothetical protein